MFPIFFSVDYSTDKYVYIEGALKYKMPLFSMLQLKRFLRENLSTGPENPISTWYALLDNEEAKFVTVEATNAVAAC